MIKLNNSLLMNDLFERSVNKLINFSELDTVTAWKLTRIFSKILDEMDNLKQVKNKLIQKYWKIDPKDNLYHVESKNYDKYFKELQKLSEQTVEIDAKKETIEVKEWDKLWITILDFKFMVDFIDIKVK